MLSSVKHRVDCHAHTVENFELFLIEARRYLAWRDDNLLALNEMGRERSPSIVSLPANMHSIHSSSRNGVIEPAKGALSLTALSLFFNDSLRKLSRGY